MKILTLLLFLISAIECKKDDKGWDTVFPSDSSFTQYDVPFDSVPLTSDIAMYEVNPRVFSITGDLQGIQAQLDSIKELGINVIWLMPVYPQGQLNSVGSPYAIKDYKKVNSEYGDLEDLRRLVKEAHKRNIAVILDWVANHTAWDHEWIKNPSWYAQDDNGNIIQPPGTNWQDVAELNYSNAFMRAEMIRCMKYWILEANVDGYRCDYADGVPADFWAQAIDTLESIPGRDIIMFAEASNRQLFSAGFQMIFGWNFYSALKKVFNENHPASELQTANSNDYNGLTGDSHILRWISNHDDNAWDDTPLAIFQGKEGSIAAFVLASYMGGVPLIYNGQEVACPVKLPFFENGNTTINWNINPEFKNRYHDLMLFRNSSNAIKRGSIVAYNDQNVVAFKRINNSEEVLVIVNVRSTTQAYQLPATLQNTTWHDAFSSALVELGAAVNLNPFSYLILEK